MAISTASDICQHALYEINELGAGETMSADDGAFSLDRLNALMGDLRTQKLAIPYPQTRTTWTIVSGDGSYTVGTSADVNRVRPTYVNHVYYQDTSISPTEEFQLEPLSDDDYARIPQKTLTATVPSTWYYNPTYPTGTLDFWPVPTSSTLQGVMYAPTGLPDFSALTESLSLPDGYARMLIKNLAVDLATPYGREVSAALAIEAERTRGTIKALNLRISDLSIDSGALCGAYRSWWDIRVGP